MAGLYVHVPLQHASPSTDDAPNVVSSPFDEPTVVAALSREVERYVSGPLADTPIKTLYLGGGRPSLLSPSAVDTLLDALTKPLHTSAIEEITIEVHPEDASLSFLNALHDRGIHRLSLEASSFVPAAPPAAGSSPSAEAAVQAVRRTRTAGFQTFSVDLHFGGPNHPLSHWKSSLQRAVRRGIPHIALHERKSEGDENDDEEARAERLAFAMTFLHAKGYKQYELTHFARPGHHSRHQETYYTHGNVLGLGPGAESFWWTNRPETTEGRRWSNVTDVAAYVEALRTDQVPVAQREMLDRIDLAREYVLLRLRTSEGLDLEVLNTHYGVDLRARHGALLSRLAAEGLIHDDPGRVRLTDRGRLLTDAITQRLLPS